MAGLSGWIQSLLAARSARGRAGAFASCHFAGCETHSREAAAVHRAIERLSPKPRRKISLGITIADILGTPDSPHLKGLDALDVAELVMALEGEWGVSSSAARRTVSDEAWSVVMARLLLGPAAETTTWEPKTIWARSVGGVINERARWAGGCRCSEEKRRPTTS
jgi:hypothetical protein